MVKFINIKIFIYLSKMEKLYKKQKKFQELVGNDIISQQFRNDMMLALIAEVIEAANETPWKPWKKHQSFDRKKFLEELADVQIFLINLVLSANADYKEFEKIIENKINTNFKRQKNGY